MTDPVHAYYSTVLTPTVPHCKAVDARAVELAGGVADCLVLDMGCGVEAPPAAAAAARRWIALDYSLPALRVRSDGSPRCLADARQVPFRDAAFDVVVDFSAGDHWRDEGLRVIYAESTRVLRPGGRMIVTYAALEVFKVRESPDYGRQVNRSAGEMAAMLLAVGLKPVLSDPGNEGRALVIARKP